MSRGTEAWRRDVRWLMAAPWSDRRRYWSGVEGPDADAGRQGCGWCGSVFAEHRCALVEGGLA